MVIQRGSIWWASLPEPVGSEPGSRRPVLVVQADSYNRSRLRTVVVVALTSNLRLAEAPGNVLIPADRSGLPGDSVANVSQVLSADRSFLTVHVRELEADLMAQVDRGLRMVLAL